MTTRVIFNIDKKLKEAAMRKARKEGLPLSSVLTLATRAYVEDRLGIDAVEVQVARSLEDVRHGRVSSSEEMFKRLGL